MISWSRIDRHIERWLERRLPPGDVARCILGDLREELGARRPGPRRTLSLLIAAVDLGLRYGRTAREHTTTPATSPAAGRTGAARRGGLHASWLLDLRNAGRSLLGRPGFALVVVLTLGLGIGATGTIYSVVDGVLLRPLPYEDPSALVVIGSAPDADSAQQGLGLLPMDAFLRLRDRVGSLHSAAAIERTNVFLRDDGRGPDEMSAARVSSELFDILGVTPALGRSFLAEEHRPEAEGALLLSYAAWQSRYGGDPSVLGRPAERLYSPATIVGVLPQGFEPPEAIFPTDEPPEVWLPLQPDHRRYTGPRPVVTVLARLGDGATLRLAEAEVAEIGEELSAARPAGAEVEIGLGGLHAQTVGSSRGALHLFLAAAGLLLLLTAMNAASLFLARLLDRTEELGVREALGARRTQLARLLLFEAAVVAVASAALGVLLARVGVAAFLALAPESIPRFGSVAVDGRVLGAIVVLSLGAVLGACALPVLRILWRGAGRIGGLGPATAGRSRARSVLVSGQVAAAVVLLAGASLLFNSFLRLQASDPGFEPDDLVTLRVGIEGAMRAANGTMTSVAQAWDVALEGVASLPGVEAVAGASALPFQAPSWSPRLLLPGDAPETWREGIAGYAVTPDYFDTLGARILRGRGFEPTDREGTERVALVNASFVRTQLDGADPLGTVLRSSETGLETEMRVVGLVEDIVQARTEDGPRPAIYVPHTQHRAGLQAIVRTGLDRAVVAAELRRVIAGFNPIEPPREILTMRERMGGSRTTPRFQAFLIAAFAGVALVLAATGLAGSLAHSIVGRQRELAVRVAVGARRKAVLAMILTEGMRVSLVGLAIGLVATLGLARFLAGSLYGVKPHDPLTLLTVVAVLLAVCLAACLVPARRATTVDPVKLLTRT